MTTFATLCIMSRDMVNLLSVSIILEMLAITVWVGGMIVLSFIVAPAIFQTAPSRDSAGRSFGLMLRRFHLVAYACGLVILATSLFRLSIAFVSSRPYLLPLVVEKRAALLVRLVIVIVMIGLTLYSGLYVSRRIEGLRSRIPEGIDHLAKSDRRREQFNNLHRHSTTIMAFNLLLGIALAVLFVVG
jgi:uncharacterized membrane protein